MLNQVLKPFPVFFSICDRRKYIIVGIVLPKFSLGEEKYLFCLLNLIWRPVPTAQVYWEPNLVLDYVKHLTESHPGAQSFKHACTLRARTHTYNFTHMRSPIDFNGNAHVSKVYKHKSLQD